MGGYGYEHADEKLLAGFEANKFTIEELEAVVEILEKCDPLTPVETSALTKMCWHIATAHDEMSVEQRRKDADCCVAVGGDDGAIDDASAEHA